MNRLTTLVEASFKIGALFQSSAAGMTLIEAQFYVRELHKADKAINRLMRFEERDSSVETAAKLLNIK